MYLDSYVYPNANYGYEVIQRAAQFNVGQCAQTAMIVNQLRPFPQPAYTVANPYATPTATA